MPTDGLLSVAVVASAALAGFAAWHAWRRAVAPRRAGAGAGPACDGPSGAAVVTAGSPPAAPLTDPGAVAVEASDTLTADEVFHRLHNDVFGMAADAAQRSASAGVHAVVFDATRAVLAKIETQPRYIPRRPHLLPQLMRTVNDPDASGRAIAAIIQRDPTLAGNLLRVANSALYRVQARPVESVERAVALVGTDGLRRIIAAALVQPVISTGAGVFGRAPTLVWEHTQLSAWAGAEHARRIGKDDPFAAQLLALLLGLGAIVVVQVLREQYARRPSLTPDLDAAARLVQALAAPTAARIARHWELPERLSDALEHPSTGPDDATGNALAKSLRFGQLAGALAWLHARDRITEPQALETLGGHRALTAAEQAIWDGLQHPPEPAAGGHSA